MKIATLFLISVSLILSMPETKAQSAGEANVEPVNDIVLEISQNEATVASANNEDFLRRDVLFFAKRHRFVKINHEVLEKSKRFTIRLFDDVILTVEKRKEKHNPLFTSWTGVVIDPALPPELRAYPSGELLEKDDARELYEQMHEVRISSFINPSDPDGKIPHTIRMSVRVPALKSRFAIRGLENDSSVHVVYEVDPVRCCFASLDGELDPSNPDHAARIELAREYEEFVGPELLDNEVQQVEGVEDRR